MRYFVTGATGFIGGHLTKRLINDGHEVAALVRDPKKAGDLQSMGAEIFTGDITRKETLGEPMEGCDGVFHVAAWYKVGAQDSEKAEETNVQGTSNVLHTMKELSIPKGVYTSTVAVFSNTHGELKSEDYIYKGKHLSEYDHTKWEAHYSIAKPMILNQDLPLVIVMPSVVYGPGDTSSVGRLFDDYLRGKLGILPCCTKYCWSHVDDIVQGHILAMDKGREGESYIIAGEPHSMVEAFEIAERITGVKRPRIELSSGTLRFMSRFMSIFNTFLNLPERYHPETLRVAAGVSYMGDSTKAKNDLAFDPRPLEKGFRDYLPARMEELGVKR
ncbi:MAG: NAD-dependent epimerase/dehydratase family protein [Thermoplasmatota archaeon]